MIKDVKIDSTDELYLRQSGQDRGPTAFFYISLRTNCLRQTQHNGMI